MLEKCIECSETQNDVTNCEITTCPLHSMRLNKANAYFDKEEIGLFKKKCLDCCNGQAEEVKNCNSERCPLRRFIKLLAENR
jgi:hypothetical protein